MSRGRPTYSRGKIHVMSEMCSTCVFRPGNLMHLQPGRLKELVDVNVGEGAALTCHKTTFGQSDQEAVCRGYYDSQKDRVPALQLAQAMDIIEEVAP